MCGSVNDPFERRTALRGQCRRRRSPVGASSGFDQADELLPWLEWRPVTGGEDVQVLPRSEDEHRDPVRTETRAEVRASVRSRRICDGDVVTGLDPGQELVVRGGVVEQHGHPGVEVCGPSAGDG